MMKRLFGSILIVIEILMAMTVVFIAAVTLLTEHSGESARAINFWACMIIAVFLFAFSLITGKGETKFDAASGMSKDDYIGQEILRHGDGYIAPALAAIAVINFMLPTVPGFMMAAQFIMSALGSFWVIKFVIVQKKLAQAELTFKNAAIFYRAPDEAREMARRPWAS